MSEPKEITKKIKIPLPPPPIPDQVIDELYDKLLQRFRLYRIPRPPTKEFLKEHTVVNHQTYQVTIFLKDFLDGYRFTRDITIQFEKPPTQYKEIEQKEIVNPKTGAKILIANPSNIQTSSSELPTQKKQLNNKGLIKVGKAKEDEGNNNR